MSQTGLNWFETVSTKRVALHVEIQWSCAEKKNVKTVIRRVDKNKNQFHSAEKYTHSPLFYS